MTRNLRSLVQASTGVAPVAGQSFRAHVTGAASLATQREYLLNGFASWSGNPTTPFPVYADGYAFALVGTFDRNSRFYHIQQNTLSRWSISVIGGSGAAGSLSAFSFAGSPTGATHSLTATIRGAYNGTPSVAPTFFANTPPNPLSDPWAITWISGVAGGTPSGSSVVTLQLSYNPDLGGFNPAIVGQWDFSIDNRAFDMEVNWFRNVTDYNNAVANNPGWEANVIATSANFTPVGITGIYPTTDAGLYIGESATLYLRYRSVGASWSNHGAVTATN